MSNILSKRYEFFNGRNQGKSMNFSTERNVNGYEFFNAHFQTENYQIFILDYKFFNGLNPLEIINKYSYLHR